MDRRAGVGWLVALALPVLCCVGLTHTVLLSASIGSLSVLIGATTGSRLLTAAGLVLAAATAAAVVVVRRRPQ